jgi:hypothetical protein
MGGHTLTSVAPNCPDGKLYICDIDGEDGAWNPRE